ncbi:universal stress protein UspE [Alteromonadaceae bacterium M269]|nr:universal stress protein UspE [Alteromonadaceae bacterium M269]
MKIPKQILVVVSGRHAEHPALERALKFAQFNDVHIHLFNSIYEPVMELTDVLSSDHRKALKRQYMADRHLYMETLADELQKQGINSTIHVVWHRELHEAIEQAVDEIAPDLVIKRISADASSTNPFTMPVDRHLIRYCKVPLLLIKDAEWQNKTILAAIDPNAQDEAHKTLNRDILDYARMISHTTESDFHTVNSYIVPTLMPVMGMGYIDVDFDRIRRDTIDSHESKIEALLSECDLSHIPSHVIEGAPDEATPELADKLGTQLVILGTVGRTGLSAAFIGNTAEHILANLNCDILTLSAGVDFGD